MEKNQIELIIQRQREFFCAGTTRDVTWRIEQLRALKKIIQSCEQEILAALRDDLRKPEFEAYSNEVYVCLQEINYMCAHLKKWAREQKVYSSIPFLARRTGVVHEPYGIVFVIAPWNFPLHLSMIPLIGAIAAGNCVVVKPSEFAPKTAQLIKNMIDRVFAPEFVTVVFGNAIESEALLTHQFDYIFFTGSANVGKKVMAAAATNLTPLTLELGGKNPCFVDKTVNLSIAAKRIAWGKFLNSGQCCVAPDYLLVESTIKRQFIEHLKFWIEQFYGVDPEKSPDYGRIINMAHVNRLEVLMGDAKIVYGGKINKETLYVAPTILDGVSFSSSCMREEIFGPILPIISVECVGDAINILSKQPESLAVYCFSNGARAQKGIQGATRSGGFCINDVIVQAVGPMLPFGGVGASGFGRYHGKASFETFSQKRVMMSRTFWCDLPDRYPPYGRKAISVAQRILKFFVR